MSTHGHHGYITASCFNSTSDRLYTASHEGDICIWNASGNYLETWEGHVGPVYALEFDHFDNQLISAGHDHTIRIWQSADVSVDGNFHRWTTRKLMGHKAGVRSLALTKTYIASASMDCTIGIWQRKSGKHLYWLEGHKDGVTCIGFLDSDTLVSGSRDCTLQIWDLTTQKCIRVLSGHKEWVTRLEPLSNHRAISTSEDRSAILWDCNTGTIISKPIIAGPPIWGLAKDPDELFAIVDGTRLVNLTDFSCEDIPSANDGFSLSISPSAEFAMLGDLLYNLAKRHPIRQLDSQSEGVASCAINDTLCVSGTLIGDINIKVDKSCMTIPAAHHGFVYCMELLDNNRFLSGSFDHRVHLWDGTSGEILKTFRQEGIVFSLSVPAEKNLFLSAGGECLRLMNLTTGQPIWQRDEVGSGVHTMAAIDASANLIASVGEDKLLRLWRLEAGDQTPEIFSLPYPHSSAIAFIPGSNAVVIGNNNGHVGLFEFSNGCYSLLHNIHEDWVRTLRVSTDGQQVMSVSQNGTSCLFDLSLFKVVSNIAKTPVVSADIGASGEVYWLDCNGIFHQN